MESARRVCGRLDFTLHRKGLALSGLTARILFRVLEYFRGAQDKDNNRPPSFICQNAAFKKRIFMLSGVSGGQWHRRALGTLGASFFS